MKARLLPMLGVALALVACSATTEPSVRTIQPTSNAIVYHVMDRPEIQHHMHVLADELLTLTGLTAQAASTAGDVVRNDVLASLDRIAARARRVGGDGVVTNYSVVDDYMGGFLEDVELSREFALRQPPNLVPANRLVQSCLACHRSL